MPERTSPPRTRPERAEESPLARIGRSLLPSMLAVVVLTLAACSAEPVDVPEDAVLDPSSSVPQSAGGPTAGGAVADAAVADGAVADGSTVDGGELTRLITLCLARYGLGERPPPPDGTAGAQLPAQQLIDAYDATLATCTAEALGRTAPSTAAPAATRPTPIPSP